MHNDDCLHHYQLNTKAASELTALAAAMAAAMARSARVPMLQCWRALPTAVAAAKVDHSDTAFKYPGACKFDKFV